jgi:hypothetical protein
MAELEEQGRLDTGGASIPLTAADESYTHQLVAPHLQTEYVHPRWGDRCYHQLHVEDLAINLGRQLYPHDGRRFAFAGIATPERMYCLRAAEPFAPGDDPNQATIGSVTIEVVRPLEEIRLRAVDPDFPVSLDLTYVGRFAPVPTDRNRIEVRGEVVTDYMNFFQSGLYSGTITIEGRRYEIRDRAGFRDRGWGIRKHESSSRRGIVLAVFCELEDRALYALLYETASGRRALSNGWLLDSSGLRDRATAIEHDLELDGTLVTGGSIDITWTSGETERIEFHNEVRNYLAGIGYALDPDLKQPGIEVFDLGDPEVVAHLDGQNDQGCHFEVGGQTGHGYVETGIGVHPRYRPQPD